MGEAPVDDVWSCEAARSLELGAEEWRNLALFAAYDDGQLEQVLASTPLRVPDRRGHPALAAPEPFTVRERAVWCESLGTPGGRTRVAPSPVDYANAGYPKPLTGPMMSRSGRLAVKTATVVRAVLSNLKEELTQHP